MKLHQYIIDDTASGEKHLVSGSNFRRGRQALLDKLMEIHQTSIDGGDIGIIDERLGVIIQDDGFHESPLSTINKWLFDVYVQAEFSFVSPRKIICLCGSTKFSEAYQKANLDETIAGNIVLTIGCDMRSDADLFNNMDDKELQELKENLDTLHLRKIDLADEVLVLNVGGYIGASTTREVEYARNHNVPIRWLEPDKIPEVN